MDLKFTILTLLKGSLWVAVGILRSDKYQILCNGFGVLVTIVTLLTIFMLGQKEVV